MRSLPSKIIIVLLVLIVIGTLIILSKQTSFLDYLENLQPALGYPDYQIGATGYAARDLSDYQLFWGKLKKDKSFITYDMLQNLGRFRSFVCGDFFRCGIESYNYEFKDKNNCYYILHISRPRQCSSNLKHINEVSDYIDLTDLRVCKEPIDGVFTIHDVCFTYTGGVLRSLRWNTATHTFNIDLNSDVSSYKLGSNTFLAQILNGRTMPAAIMNFNLTVQLGTFIRQTGILRAILDGLLAVLFLAWGILQKKNVPKYCKKALQIEDEDKRSQYLRDCGKLKFLLAAVFAVMALVEYCEPVFFSAFLLLYAILLVLVYWQYRLIHKEAFAEVTDSSLRSE